MKSDKSESSQTHNRPWSGSGFFRKAPLLRFGLVLILSLLIAFLMSPNLTQRVRSYKLGEYTTSSIRAPYDFSVVDKAATERKREEAVRKTVPVADYDSGMATKILERVQGAFVPVQNLFAEASEKQQIPEEELKGLTLKRRNALIKERTRQAKKYLAEKLDQGVAAFEETLHIDLTPAKRNILIKVKFGESFANGVGALIREAYSQPVVTDRAPIRKEVEGDTQKKDGPGKLALRNASTGAESVISDISILRTPKQLEAILAERAATLLPTIDHAQQSVIVQIATAQCKPDLFLNAAETQARRLAARSAVIPVSYTFKKNQLVLGEGQEVTEQKLLVLQYLRNREMPEEFFGHLTGSTLFLFMLIAFGFWIVDINAARVKLADKDFIFIAVSLVLFVVLFRVWLFIVNGIVARYPTVPPLPLVLMFPVGMAAMQTRFLLNFEAAILQSAIIAFLSGMLSVWELPFAIYSFLVCLVAGHVVGGCNRRSAVLRAGLWVGVASVAAAACMVLLSENGMTHTFIFIGAGALIGGLATGFAVLAISPLAEWAFGYITDITLLEMSNYEHPLLKRIMVETPGTFQHSINIGILAEAAAKAVGANPLLTRVGSLFHDAGKVRNPGMFTENHSGASPHDLLPPEESAGIIRAHINDGVELVRGHGLGESIADFVREHHGTGVIRYFLEKAKDQGAEIKLADYTYSGPKPRSKETAILMIADQVEATSRTMGNKTSEEFREMVRQTISRIHEEGQLDDCPLALQDISKIQEALVGVLVGMHHDRIKYPDQAT